jgi:maleylacetoacetate isomerase
MLKLYHYWRSTSSWRVRWALEYKKIPHQLVPINLLSGESETPAHLARHPAGFVPVLEIDTGETLIESLAIIQYLEAAFPESLPLFPKDPFIRSQALALAEIINSGTHPLQNPPVAAYLFEHFGASPDQQTRWNQHWIQQGLQLYENLLSSSVIESPSPFSLDAGFSIADVCLMPQLYNAHRYGVSLQKFPKILAIEANLSTMKSYLDSHPDRSKPIEA